MPCVAQDPQSTDILADGAGSRKPPRNAYALFRSVTDDEYAAIVARAAEARVSVQRYLVERALSRKPSPRTAPSALRAELAALRRLSANLANNMNQIARRLNAGADPDARILAASYAVLRTMRRLDAALAWLDAPVPRNGAPMPQSTAPAQRNDDTVQEDKAASERNTDRQPFRDDPERINDPSAERKAS